MNLKNPQFLTMLEKMFKVPTLLGLVSSELSQAKLQLLEAEAAVDYAQSLANYNKARIERLTTRLENLTKEERAKR